MNSPTAVNLLLGTAAQESNMGYYRRQIGGGPAVGIFQMEPNTLCDIWTNYLRYRPVLDRRMGRLVDDFSPEGLVTSDRYAVIMARLHYRRVKEPFPEPNDIKGLAHYWKDHYNTKKGKGTVEEFIENYKRYVLT